MAQFDHGLETFQHYGNFEEYAKWLYSIPERQIRIMTKRLNTAGQISLWNDLIF